MPRWLFHCIGGPSFGGPAYKAYSEGRIPNWDELGWSPHFLEGDIIVPKDRTSKDFKQRCYTVEAMTKNEYGHDGVTVYCRPFGEPMELLTQVWVDAYDLATNEEIAEAVARRLRGTEALLEDAIRYLNSEKYLNHLYLVDYAQRLQA